VEWPVVIAQHMPEKFLRSFCRRLNELFSRRFLMADDGVTLRSNHAVLAIGKDVSTHLVRPAGGPISCRIATPSVGATYRPSVNDLFVSAANAGLTGAAVVLTGMGGDGAQGLLALRQRGFVTFGQSENSCVVFGMPKAARALGAVQHMQDPGKIGAMITRHSQKNPTGTESVS
jgi:two-component system chemotaxis response regulator CheB